MMSDAQRRAILGVLLLAHMALASAYSIWNPLAEAPDEADHFAVIRYLAAKRALPSGPRVTQSKHPPLYYVGAAIAASAGDPLDYAFLRANPDVSIQPVAHWSPNFFIHTTLEDWPWRAGPLAFHLARLWSVLLSTLAIWATYSMVRTGFPGRDGLALASAGLLAFIPEFSFIGGAVNNDSAAALAGALILWGALALYQRGGRWQAAWWTSLAMAFGLLVKVSTAALWPVVILAAVLGATGAAAQADGNWGWTRSVRQSWRRWAGSSTVIIAAALLIASPWLVRNWRLYGDPLGATMAAQTIDLRTTSWTMADTGWLLKGWFVSFWGKFGGAGHIPMPAWIYWVLATAVVAAAAGLIRVWTRGDERDRPVLFLLALAIACVAIGIWRYSLVALGTDQGRLLYPANSAIVTLLAVGSAAWIPLRARRGAAAIAIAAVAALGIYGLAGVIRPSFAPPPHLRSADLPPAASPAGMPQFGPLTLIEWQLSETPLLTWYAPHATQDDLRTVLRVVADDGAVVWEWRRSPGYGRFSTDRWPAGTIIDDEYSISWPEWAGPGIYRLEVGVQLFGGEDFIPTIDGNPPDPDSAYYTLGMIERR
jgi:hypothetical protein